MKLNYQLIGNDMQPNDERGTQNAQCSIWSAEFGFPLIRVLFALNIILLFAMSLAALNELFLDSIEMNSFIGIPSAIAGYDTKSAPSEKEGLLVSRLRFLASEFVRIESDTNNRYRLLKGQMSESVAESFLGYEMHQDGILFGQEVALILLLNHNLSLVDDFNSSHPWFKEEMKKILWSDDKFLLRFISSFGGSFGDSFGGLKFYSGLAAEKVVQRRWSSGRGNALSKLYLSHLKEAERIRNEMFPQRIYFLTGLIVNLFFAHNLSLYSHSTLNYAAISVFAGSMFFSINKGHRLWIAEKERISQLNRAKSLRTHSWGHVRAFMRGAVAGYCETVIGFRNQYGEIPLHFLLEKQCAQQPYYDEELLFYQILKLPAQEQANNFCDSQLRNLY